MTPSGRKYDVRSYHHPGHYSGVRAGCDQGSCLPGRTPAGRSDPSQNRHWSPRGYGAIRPITLCGRHAGPLVWTPCSRGGGQRVLGAGLHCANSYIYPVARRGDVVPGRGTGTGYYLTPAFHIMTEQTVSGL
jgi:hypothetical protein